MIRRLPTTIHEGTEYFIDMRLKEFRPVEKTDQPFHSIPFDSELGRQIDGMPEEK